VNIIYYFIADSNHIVVKLSTHSLEFIDACENPDGKGF